MKGFHLMRINSVWIGIHIAIVTFSGQVDLIRGVVSSHFMNRILYKQKFSPGMFDATSLSWLFQSLVRRFLFAGAMGRGTPFVSLYGSRSHVTQSNLTFLWHRSVGLENR